MIATDRLICRTLLAALALILSAIGTYGVVAYWIVVNVFYTCGWILELLVARLWRVSTPIFGPIVFTLFTVVSVVVTLVPAGLVIFLAIFTSCRGL